MSSLYMWVDHKIVTEEDGLAWARWFENSSRHVRDVVVLDMRVSTVFLGMDHGYGVTDKPVLFETIIFGVDPECAGYQQRYCTEKEAIKGHMVAIRDAMWLKFKSVLLGNFGPIECLYEDQMGYHVAPNASEFEKAVAAAQRKGS